jgi:uncharacterized protein YdhG (YjbR/CyaY superfamily)
MVAAPIPRPAPRIAVTRKPTDTASYLAALTDEQRATLERLRATIRAAAPGAEESFSYGMPGFTLGGRALVWVAAWKRHYGLYPISAALLAAHAAPGEAYETAKGTIRFPANEALPYDLVTRLVRARADEVGGARA